MNLGRRRDGIQVMDTLVMKEDIKIIVFLVSIDIIFFMVDKYMKIQWMGKDKIHHEAPQFQHGCSQRSEAHGDV